MNFMWESVQASQKAWQKLARMALQFKAETGRTVLSEDKLEKVDEYRQRFFEYIEDDLKTAEAVTVMYEVVKSNIPGSDKYDLLVEFDEVLGLGIKDLKKLSSTTSIVTDFTAMPEKVRELFANRLAARQSKDWASSDTLRDEIVALGYDVIDGVVGQQLRPIHPSLETTE